MFDPNLKLHHFLYADIRKIHKIIFPSGSDVGFISLDDLLSINFLSVDAALSRYLIGGVRKTRVSAAGASSPFLPLRVLEISSFALKNKQAPAT